MKFNFFENISKFEYNNFNFNFAASPYFEMSYLSNSDIFEFWRQRKDPEEFDLTQSWLQQLVVRCNCLMR